VSASRGGATRHRPATKDGFMSTKDTKNLVAAAILAAAIALTGCGGDGSSGFTQRSIKTGFVKPADLGGKNIIAFEDNGVAGHIIYTPEDSVPTCPYVQRADDAPAGSTAAVELQGGNATGRFIVGPDPPKQDSPPVVTQGAVVFHNAQLADAGMKTVNAAAAKCPSKWTILGGPPQIIGTYTVTSRPIELHGWKGFSQQLAHLSPKDINPDTYDDLVTVVLHKGNAILYAGFAQIKNTGERADSGEKAEQVMKQSLARLN
jgi:hypothetical protein